MIYKKKKGKNSLKCKYLLVYLLRYDSKFKNEA